ncbi:MAG: hypothetical protein VX897_06775, partial [Actinomycetota bacterium]|nr:hypothetical protein [Actinomycetota bacterium]
TTENWNSAQTVTVTGVDDGEVDSAQTVTITLSGLGVTSISTGYGHTCAVTTAGGVKCWGDNEYGKLGDGTTTDRLIPVDVSGLTSGVAAIAVGTYHSCALTTSGGVKCWGFNHHGQLGSGTASWTSSLTPADVPGLTSGVASIDTGFAWTCVVTTAGGAKCWGYGSGPSPTDQYLPEELTSGVASFSGGHTYQCALTTSGGAKCGTSGGAWGDVEGLTSGVASISAGTSQANSVGYLGCAVTTSGGAKCWGKNHYGQLGNGTTTDSPTPVDVSGLTSGVASISAGEATVCAVTTSGGAKCWGNNSFGRVGDGTTTDRSTPVDVSGLTSGVASIDSSDDPNSNYTCAVTTSGGATCWGLNQFGQLGDGTTTQRLTPVPVSGLLGGLLSSATVSVTNSSAVPGGLSVVQSDGSTGTTESGGTDSFTVVLNMPPASNVVLSVTSSDTGEVTVAPATVTFTSGNWNTAQTITVTGVDDDLVDGTQNATVTLSVVDASSDDHYDSVADVAVSVTNAEADSTVVTTTTTTTVATTTVAVGSLSLSATSSGTDGVLEWTPGVAAGLTSFTLAWRDPSGVWQSHSSHAASTMSHTLVGLAEGTHSFQVLASYADGTTTLSNDASIVVTPQDAVTPPEVIPFDCSTYPALIQVLRADGISVNVKQLDLTSGGYSLIYSSPFNPTAPAFELLNAVGLHPVDRVAYGLMKFSDETSYLVRFDDQDVAFLAKVPHSPAGTVDDDGSFLWATSDGLYRIEDVQSLSGFGTRGAATDLSAISPMIGVAADTWDLAAVRVDLGDGEAPYAMGFTGSRQLRIYRYDDSPGSWLLAATTADGSNSAIPLSGFGAAWSHDGEVFFAANSGHGVYEVL